MRNKELKEIGLEIIRKNTEQIIKQQDKIAKGKQDKVLITFMEVWLANKLLFSLKEQKKLEKKKSNLQSFKYEQHKG